MKKINKILFIIMFIITNYLVMAHESAYFYGYSNEREMYIIEKEIKETGNSPEMIKSINKMLMDYFETRIDYKLSKIYDDKGHYKTICTINVYKNKEYGLFEGDSHVITLLDSVILNYLQPEDDNWIIDMIIVKVEGIFTDELSTERRYPAIITRNELLQEQWYETLPTGK